MTRTTLVLLAVLAASARADAQTVEPRTAASFERLGLLLAQGERIRVTDGAGRDWQGRLIDLSPSTLSLRIAGVRHDLQEADVAVIRRRQRDGLGNGALVGFLSGAAVAVSLLTAEEGNVNRGAALLATSLFGAAGAGVGVGVDALIQRSQVVYRAEGASQRLTISPLLSRDRRGLSLSLAF